MLIALITFFASCQSGTDVNQKLSKTETGMEMMNKITNNSTMSKEMMGAMMKVMKDNPGMMNTMMGNMM